MNRILDILHQNNQLPIQKLCNYFREEHSKLEISDQKNFFEILLLIFTDKSEKYTAEEWDQLRLISCIFTIAFDPSINLLQVRFPHNSDNGYLISSSFILLERNIYSNELCNLFQTYFLQRLDELFTDKNTSFYSISFCYYFLINLHIFTEHFQNFPLIDHFHYLFQNIFKLQINQLSFNLISFVTDICLFVKKAINKPFRYSDEFIRAFLHMVSFSSKSPDIFLMNYFHFWFYFSKQCKSIFNPSLLSDNLHIVTDSFEAISTRKYHELHHSFPWYLLLYFYEYLLKVNYNQRLKILSIIRNGIRRVKMMDNFPSMFESVKVFSISITQQFIDNNPYDLFYMLSNLNSSLNSLLSQFDKIHAVRKVVQTDGSDIEELKKRHVTFYEQADWSINSPTIDRYLYTNSYEKVFTNSIECCQEFDRIVKICENIHHFIHSLVIFQIQICVCAKKLLASLKKQTPNSIILQQYLMNTYSSLISFMVISTYKQMELKSYSLHEFIIQGEVSSRSLPYKTNPQGMLNLIGFYQKYFDDCILKMDADFLDSLAVIVSENFFFFMKNRLITFNFLETFSTLQKNYNNPYSFINLLLNRMMELSSTQINLIFSLNIDDVYLFFMWISFIIRLATPLKGGPNYIFGILLKTYEKLIVTSVLSNLKSISHQSVAIRIVKFYLESLKFNYLPNKDGSDKIAPYRIRPIFLEDLEETSLLDTLSVIFDICLDEPEFIPENALIPLIKAGFESHDNEIITKASKVCLNIFTLEKSTKCPMTGSPGFEEQVFEMFINSMNYIDIEIASKIADIIPFYATRFLKSFPSKKIEFLLTLDLNKIDFYLILKKITEHLDNSYEEAALLFALINIYFEIIIDKFNLSSENFRHAMTLLICLLKHCSGFTNLKEKMNTLLSYITSTFGDIFIRGESNLYILCILEDIGINRSDSTSFAMRLAVSFFDYCMGKEINHNFLLLTLDSLFSFFPFSTKFFSILSGFSLFLRYYPQLIDLNHIRSLLIQTSEISPLDKSYSNVLNLFLKKFIEKSEIKTLSNFVSMAYEIICPLSISVRYVIEKRLTKLKIPLPINNLDSIAKSPDPILMFQKLTLAFLCGIDGDLMSCLNEEWINRVIQFFQPNPHETIHCFQKYVRILSLCLSILRNPEIFHFFISNEMFFNVLSKFICKAMLCHFTPVKKCAKKCWRIIKQNYFPLLMKSKMVDDFWKSPRNEMFFWGSKPDKIRFYSRLAQHLPEKAPPELIIDYFNEVDIYCEKDDFEKMNLVRNFSEILKQFTIVEYIEYIKPTILDNLSFLHNYIEKILLLHSSKTIPFRAITKKYVMKFLILFPEQSVNYLVKSQNPFGFFLLKDLIIDDMSDTFFHSFLGFFDNDFDFLSLSPNAFSIFKSISMIERFTKYPMLLQISEKIFNQIFDNSLSQNENAYSIIKYVSISYINLLPYYFELSNIIKISSIFKLSFFNQSDLFKLFKKKVFNSNCQSKMIEIIKYVFNEFGELHPGVAHVLLPYSIKTLNKDSNKPDFFLIIWNRLIQNINNEEKISTIYKSMNYLLDKSIPTKDNLKSILLSISDNITSPNSQNLIYTLKLCIKLAKLKFLPHQIFDGIIQQLFSYSKFFDSPYFTYFLLLVKSCPQFISNMSNKTIEIISFSFHDKFTNFKKIQKTLTVLMITTDLYKLLPFSFFISVSNFLMKKMKSIKNPKVEINEIREILAFLIPLFLKVETSSKENSLLIKVCFKFFKLVLTSDDSKFLFINQLFELIEIFNSLLSKHEKVEFPKKILETINNQVNDPIRFGLVCIASKFIPEFLFTEYPKLIELTLEYLKDINSVISQKLLQKFLNFIFESMNRLVYLHFQNQIQLLIFFLLKNLSIEFFDKFSIVSNSLISFHSDQFYSQLIDQILSCFYQMGPSSLSDKLFEMILNISRILPVDDQENYVNYIISHNEWSIEMKRVFTTTLPSLFTCTTLNNQAKKKFLSLIPTHVIGNETELLKIIHSVKKFSEESCCSVIGTLILLYVFIADNPSSLSSRFLCFDKIAQILEPFQSFKVRLRTLLNVLPLKLWSDDYFIYVVFILTEKNKFFHTIYSFANRLKKIASYIAIPVFNSEIDDDILNDIKKLFGNNLIKDFKFQFSQIIRTFDLFLIKLSKQYQSNKISGPFTESLFNKLPNEFTHFNNFKLSHLVYQDSFNDFIMSEIMPNPTTLKETAVYLTYLCKYEAAESLYRLENDSTNSYFNCMKELNNYLLPMKDLNLNTIIKPLIRSWKKHDNIIDNLKNCIEFIDNKEKSLEYLNLMKRNALESFRHNYSTSVYQREKFASISIISSFLESFIKEDGTLPKICRKEILYQCLNSTLINTIKNFKRFLLKKGPRKETIIKTTDEENPSILISPSIYHKFKEVSGITPHGLFALNSSQINEFLKEISIRMKNNEFKNSEWIPFAHFCFNIFLAQQTKENFLITYNSYCKVVLLNSEFSITRLNEASSRIITLIRIAISKKPIIDFTEPILKSAFLFKKEFVKVWHVWLQQLIEISNNNWFFDIAIELFTEMAYRSTLYASRYASVDIQNALHNAIVNEHSFVQISMMNKIAKILDRISSINLIEIEVQSKIQSFIDEALRLNDEEISSINLLELRHKRNFITSFENALSNLTKSDIEKIGNFENWISVIKTLDNKERELFIKDFTNSSQILSNSLNELYDVIDEFNEQMPFIFPIRGNEINTDFSIFVIHKKIKVFSPDISTFSSATSMSSNQFFLIMTKGPNGFRPSVFSINHLLAVIRVILHSSYSTVVRSINLADNYCFEIGSNTILKRLESEPISLRTFFERDLMITQHDWINENVDFEEDSEIGQLNEKGKESIKTFPHDSLSIFLKNNYGPKLCKFNLHTIAASYVSYSLIRYIMSAPYPDMNVLIMCAKSLELPVLSIDFNDIKFTEDTSYSTFRFSPSIEYICGIWGICGFKMAFAAVSNALVGQLELIRTHMEVILGDEMLLSANLDHEEKNNHKFSLDELLRKRSILENRFISLAPPDITSPSNIDEASSWLIKIDELIKKSKNPWIQPAQSIPWY